MHWLDPRIAAHQEQAEQGWAEHTLAPRVIAQKEQAGQGWAGEWKAGQGT